MNVVVIPGTFTREQKGEKLGIPTPSLDLSPSHLTKLILLLELLTLFVKSCILLTNRILENREKLLMSIKYKNSL